MGETRATAWESASVIFVSLVASAHACPCELPSVVDVLEQPGHVLAEDLANQEEMVDRVEGVHDPGPADRARLLRARLLLNHPPLLPSLLLESLWGECIMVKHGYGSRGGKTAA